jgi:ubiquinone/menaquinone biosynthesis C-methylase UbiE
MTGDEEYKRGELRDFHYKFDVMMKYVKPGKLADIGCGTGAFCRRVMSSSDGTMDVIGVDFSPMEIEICNQLRGKTGGFEEYIVGDIYNIPLQSETYDTVTCSEVLEHLSDLDKAMSELKRISKPDGKIIITVPLNEEINYKEAEKGNREHIRSFKTEDFERYFKHCRFDYFRSNLLVVGEK